MAVYRGNLIGNAVQQGRFFALKNVYYSASNDTPEIQITASILMSAESYYLSENLPQMSLAASLLTTQVLTLKKDTPEITIAATMLSGNVFSLSKNVPSMFSAATGFNQNVFSLNSKIAEIRLDAFLDSVRAAKKVIAMNIKNNGVTEYTNFQNFTGFGMGNGQNIGIANDGIYLLSADNDNGKKILGSFTLPDIDMDISSKKKLVDVYVTGSLI